MAFTAITSRANGSTNVSRADVEALFDNVAWLRTPPQYRLYAVDGGEDWTPPSLAVADYAITGSPHYEWLEGGGGDPGNVTYHSGTGGLYVNVGDVAEGVWLNGVMIASRRYTAAEEGSKGPADYFREAVLRNTFGPVVLADQFQTAMPGRRCGFHLPAAGAFNATADDVDVQIRASDIVDVPDEFQPDRRWGVRFGSLTSLSSDFEVARPTSTTQVVDWWNTLRLNMFRLERRPSCGRYRDTSGTLTANTATDVFLVSDRWSTHPDMNPAANGRIVAPYDGWYWVEGQLTIDDYYTGATYATVSIVNNLGSTVLSGNCGETYGTTSTYTTPIVSGMVKLTAGQTLKLVGTIGRTETIAAGNGQRMSATLVSSDSGVSPDRELFGPIPALADIPNFGLYSSDRLPLGVMKVLSDLTDRLWHQPVIALASADPQAVGANWTDVETTVLVDDYTDMRSLGYEPVGSGGFRVPWPGSWLVAARVQFAAASEAGVNVGDDGFRGFRLAVDGKQSVGQIQVDSMNAATHGWTRTITELFVVNDGQEGAVIGVQCCAGDMTATDEQCVVSFAQLWAVQVGDGVTRDPS